MSIKLFNSEIEIANDQSKLLGGCTEKKPANFLNSHQYSRYVMSCFVTLNQDHFLFYKLPRLLKLYQGDASYNQPTSQSLYGLAYNLNVEDASDHGFVQEFELQKDVNVMAFDKVSNIKILMATALDQGNEEMYNKIKQSFHLVGDTGKLTIVRNNDPIRDYEILEYVCSLGYDGFSTKPLMGQSTYPAEIYLCNSEILSNGIYSKFNEQFIIDIDKLFEL